MDRPEPGLIKWSPKAGDDRFMHINLQHRVLQLYEPTGHAQRGRFDYKKLSKHDDFPPLTTYDWSPSIPGLAAVGASSGVVNLLKVDDNSNAYVELSLRVSRLCQAVAFNTGNLLAVGLERVRNDQSLHIWDVSRTSALASSQPGFPPESANIREPVQRLEPSVAVASVKFFEDSPQTLAVGIKNQGIRIYDLRDQNGAAISFQTKCNNNLAIDYADQNYFASSTLDQPGVVVWDRRVTSRSSCPPRYLEAVDTDDLPWGAALRLDRAIDVQPDAFGDKHSLVRSLRYCRDQRGLLAVLSRTGQLRVLDTVKEFSLPERGHDQTPELLQVQRSDDFDLDFPDHDKRNDRIVSFDWINLESPILSPRVVVLRANGTFNVLEKPSYTSDYIYKLVPWKSPYRGLEEGASYHDVIHLDASQHSDMMGPWLIDNDLANIPLFGEAKANVSSIIHKALQARPRSHDYVEDTEACQVPLPDLFRNENSTADKLRALRAYSKKIRDSSKLGNQTQRAQAGLDHSDQDLEDMLIGRPGPYSNRERHEQLLSLTIGARGFPKAAQVLLDHIPLLRAKDKYLFDFEGNRDIVADDPWLRDMWGWVAGAEDDAFDGKMIAGGFDLSYFGARTIWANDLGSNGSSRIIGVPASTDALAWERCLQTISNRLKLPRWEGVKTRWPAHRQVCTRACGWDRYPRSVQSDHETQPAAQNNSSCHTMAAAHALFRGDITVAVQRLKAASTDCPELLFVSLALQLINRGDKDLAKEQLDFDETVASKTDPYLRAISSLIATNDWDMIANQDSLPLRERTFVALRYFDDARLTRWLDAQVSIAVSMGDIEGIVLTGITDELVDIFARYVEKFNDYQTATLVMSICAPRYIDDYRCLAWRNAYRAYLQRHKAFYQRVKFEVESTKKSKRDGVPTVKPPSRQIALRCVYCDAEYELSKAGSAATASVSAQRNPLMMANINAGISCPNCGRHLPRCVVCLEVVGVPRSDRPEASSDPEKRVAAKFPTFCLKCEHVLHLDHARQWFARHVECPVPECRCRCNFRANPELNYH